MTATAGRGRRLIGRGDDRGSVTLFAVVLAFAMLAMGGLVLDGGRQLTAQRRADNQAEQAARAGAQAVDLTALRSGQHPVLAPAAARAAATAYLTGAGYRDITVTITGAVIDVRLTATTTTAVLGIVGIASLTVTGTGHAELLRGVQEAQP